MNTAHDITSVIRSYLDQINKEDFISDEDLPDFISDDPEKLHSIYFMKLFDLLADRLEILRNRYGSSKLTSMMVSIAIDQPSSDAMEIMKDNFEDLIAGDEAVFGELNFDDWLKSDGLTLWDKILVFIGVSPKYRSLMEEFFGNYGLVSLMVMLKTLSTRHIDLPFLMKMLTKEQGHGSD